jgi:hypothetical protein
LAVAIEVRGQQGDRTKAARLGGRAAGGCQRDLDRRLREPAAAVVQQQGDRVPIVHGRCQISGSIAVEVRHDHVLGAAQQTLPGAANE